MSMTGLVVDDPTDADVSKLLELMTLRPVKRMWLTNREQVEATRGTPGEVIPCYQIGYGAVPMFYGDFEGLEDETWHIAKDHFDRMRRGETIVYKVKNATIESDANGFYRIVEGGLNWPWSWCS